ncbi:MAG: PAC2 family protein [Actinobacteria bacterium]|nr:PAC2 family protein [Actinomycetota bacterium]
MPGPDDLYEVSADLPELHRPVLLCSLDGFVDAGAVAGLVREQVLADLDSKPVVTFDVDRLVDYRARRPLMSYSEDHWESYDAPLLAMHAVRDSVGAPFLLLTGPEPDYAWDRFTAAVGDLVQRFDVRLTVNAHGIPMAVPHTRPIGLTAHATRPELVTGYPRWLNQVQVPGSAAALLELRLGAAGHDAMGFAVHVPHYLARAAYPAAALAAVEAISTATGLVLPTGSLRTAGDQADAQITEQIEDSPEVAAVVRTLEEQYDAYLAAREHDDLLAEQLAGLPTADQLGAEFERFLAERQGRRDSPDL